MQTCGSCGEEKPLSDFKMRTKPPIQPYKWCKTCCKYTIARSGSYSTEMKEMRNKGVQMRKFTPAQDVEIYRRKAGGATYPVLRAEYNASLSALAKAVQRGKALDTPPGVC